MVVRLIYIIENHCKIQWVFYCCPQKEVMSMYALNLTPKPFTGNVVSGKWKVSFVRQNSSEYEECDFAFYRADDFRSLLETVGRLKKGLIPVKIELVGLYYYELFFDLDGKDELPFDLSIFLYCIFG